MMSAPKNRERAGNDVVGLACHVERAGKVEVLGAIFVTIADGHSSLGIGCAVVRFCFCKFRLCCAK